MGSALITAPEAKRGDWYGFAWSYQDADEARDFTGAVVTCQARTLDGSQAWDLTVENVIAGNDGSIAADISATGEQTQEWSISGMRLDVQVDLDGDDATPFSSKTVHIPVVRDETRPA